MERHHFSVTTVAGSSRQERWFHLFAEAQERFDEEAEAARGRGLEERSSDYWRKHLAGPEGAAELALDDVGMVVCGPLCGAGAGD